MTYDGRFIANIEALVERHLDKLSTSTAEGAAGMRRGEPENDRRGCMAAQLMTGTDQDQRTSWERLTACHALQVLGGAA